MPEPQLTDAELLAAIKRNDQKAFRLLFERYWAIIYKRAFSYLNDADACAELVNDIFQSIWENRECSNIINVKNYLTAAARYRVYSHLQTVRKTPLMYVESYEEIEPATDDYYAPTAVRLKDLNRQLEILLSGLPERCREMFLLSRNEHLTNKQIAQRLGISQRTVENQISSALKYLRLKLKQISIIILFITLMQF